MNKQVHLGIVSLMISTALLCSSNENSTANNSSNNTATATAANISANVGNIVSTATGLVSNHSPSAIVSSVGQLVNSLLSIVSSLIHRYDDATDFNNDAAVDYSSITSEAYEIDSDDESSDSLSASNDSSFEADDFDASDVSDESSESADDSSDDASDDQDEPILVTININEPITITLDEEQLVSLIEAIQQARQELQEASLQVLANELQQAEAAAQAEASKRKARGDQLDEQEAAVTQIVQALIHDLFALVQEGSADAQTLGEEIAVMLSAIIEQAVDTVKYEQLTADDVDACAARYIDRVCAEFTRQIHHLLVQSALVLRNSQCTVDCCKRPARMCAAAVAMITGQRDKMAVRSGCNTCCKPSCNNCNCNNNSCCTTCNNNSGKCCCKRTTSMEETRKGCGCNKQCPTCRSGDCQDGEHRCPCMNKPATKKLMLKCPCMNKPKQATTSTDDQPRFRPSYKENGRYVPETFRS